MLYILCGIPGIGKSTWAREQLGCHGVRIVSTDDLRDAFFEGVFSKGTNPRVFRMAYDLLREGLDKGGRVCFDATNLTPKDRRTALLIGKKGGVPVIGIALPNDPDVAIQRAGMRERQVPADVILGMSGRFVPPSLREGFSQVWNIVQ